MTADPQQLAPDAAPDLLLGRMLAGKYRLEMKLGEGGMGAVYKARQIALEKTIAVKVMHKELASDPMFAARFHREAKAASKLDHPNSIGIMDFGEEPDGLLYIAMEFLDGRDLLSVVEKEGPLSPERIVDILSQALSALGVAHEMGIIHRDLKPENIMILRRKGEDERVHDVVKVCDFGIAKLEGAGDAAEAPPTRAMKGKLTTAGLVIGTPEYMSPEQGRGEALDVRSDLYSMGVILYLLLSGQTPFDAPTPLGIVLKHQNEEPQPPSRYKPSTDPRLEAVCLKAMSKRPSDRYASAREMRAALRAVIGGTLIDASVVAHVSGAKTELLVQPPTQVVPAGLGVVTPALTPGPLTTNAGPLMTTPGGPLAFADPARAATAPLPAARAPRRTGLKIAVTLVAVAMLGGGALYGWWLHDEDAAPPTEKASIPPAQQQKTTAPVPTPQEPRPVTPTPPSSHAESLVKAPVTAPTILKKEKEAPLSAPSAEATHKLGGAVATPSPAADPPPAPAPPPPSPQPPPAPTQPQALPVVLPPAVPAFDPKTVHVEPAGTNVLAGGVSRQSVNNVIKDNLGRITTCYRSSATATSPEGAWNLKIATDDSGTITDARLDGPLPESAKSCISGAMRGKSLPVDTGAVTATVLLKFSLR